MPLASEEKALIVPSGLSAAPVLAKPIVAAGASIMLMPPATARSDSCRRSELTASWIATREVEQAVSSVMDGPRKSNVYETRLEMIALEAPVTAYGEAAAESEVRNTW